jgi:dynein heavy chain
MFLSEAEAIPWPALEYVVGQINYGGRVTDDLDRRCLMSILRRYITPDVLEDSYAFTPSGAPGGGERRPLAGAARAICCRVRATCPDFQRLWPLPNNLRLPRCSPRAGLYAAPSAECSLDEVRDYIRGLPPSEAPEVFGMHANANISFQLQVRPGLGGLHGKRQGPAPESRQPSQGRASSQPRRPVPCCASREERLSSVRS